MTRESVIAESLKSCVEECKRVTLSQGKQMVIVCHGRKLIDDLTKASSNSIGDYDFDFGYEVIGHYIDSGRKVALLYKEGYYKSGIEYLRHKDHECLYWDNEKNRKIFNSLKNYDKSTQDFMVCDLDRYVFNGDIPEGIIFKTSDGQYKNMLPWELEFEKERMQGLIKKIEIEIQRIDKVLRRNRRKD